jgi:hypothetical protein
MAALDLHWDLYDENPDYRKRVLSVTPDTAVEKSVADDNVIAAAILRQAGENAGIARIARAPTKVLRRVITTLMEQAEISKPMRKRQLLALTANASADNGA